MTESQGRESLFSSERFRPYLRHLPGCQMLASHVPHELICTCGLDALMLELASCAADESVGERQGRQANSDDRTLPNPIYVDPPYYP